MADSGQNEPKAVANPTARVDHDIILITQDIVPTSNPIKSPKAFLEYRYAPPFLSNMLPTSAKHKSIDRTKSVAKMYINILF